MHNWFGWRYFRPNKHQTRHPYIVHGLTFAKLGFFVILLNIFGKFIWPLLEPLVLASGFYFGTFVSYKLLFDFFKEKLP